MWESVVELVRVAIVSVAQVCGGSLGTAVLLVSVGVRLALLPLTLRMARQSRIQQERMAKLAPATAALQKLYAKDPAKLWQETTALYRTHDIRLLSPSAMIGLLVQAPLFGALFSATRRGLGAKIRFLWIAELARPDAALSWVVAGLTAIVMAGAVASGGDKNALSIAALIMAAVMGLATVAFLWSASSAVALSVGAGSVVSGVQSLILVRERRR